jgi:3-carboxy-cis,cis-muconate cycloisomerase
MTIGLAESGIFGDEFGTDEMRTIFSDRELLATWVACEVALLQAAAKFGLVPLTAAAELRQVAQTLQFDLESMRREIRNTGHPLVPFIYELERVAGDELQWFIHWGATTQDITDTAQILVFKSAWALIETQVAELESRLARLAAQERDTVMAGRTHGQQALPITFGYKVAVWLVELGRHRDRLREARSRIFVGQLSGAVGSFSSFGEHGFKVQVEYCRILGLGIPAISWHAARDGLAEGAAVLSLLAATLAKVATEVINLQRSEIAEVQEPGFPANVGSSAMPHKRNPMLSETVVALSRLARSPLPAMVEGMVQAHERDMTSWGVEWDSIPRVCTFVSAALKHTQFIISGLRVDRDRMRSNLKLLGPSLLSESLMYHLAKGMGRGTAHEVVHRVFMEAGSNGDDVVGRILADPEVGSRFRRDELDAIINNEASAGLCAAAVDAVLASRAKKLENGG